MYLGAYASAGPCAQTPSASVHSTFRELKMVRLPKKMTRMGTHRGFSFVDFLTQQDAKVRPWGSSRPLQCRVRHPRACVPFPDCANLCCTSGGNAAGFVSVTWDRSAPLHPHRSSDCGFPRPLHTREGSAIQLSPGQAVCCVDRHSERRAEGARASLWGHVSLVTFAPWPGCG